jgi:hypothetical protein
MTAEKVLKILVTVAKYFIGMAEKEMRGTDDLRRVQRVGIDNYDSIEKRYRDDIGKS